MLIPNRITTKNQHGNNYEVTHALHDCVEFIIKTQYSKQTNRFCY